MPIWTTMRQFRLYQLEMPMSEQLLSIYCFQKKLLSMVVEASKWSAHIIIWNSKFWYKLDDWCTLKKEKGKVTTQYTIITSIWTLLEIFWHQRLHLKWLPQEDDDIKSSYRWTYQTRGLLANFEVSYKEKGAQKLQVKLSTEAFVITTHRWGISNMWLRVTA